MFQIRCFRVVPKICQKRFMCQKTIEQIQKGEKRKLLWEDAKHLYVETVPFITSLTVFGSLFSFYDGSEITPLEHFIYSVTTGCLLGVSYPVSFPIVALIVFRKRNQ